MSDVRPFEEYKEMIKDMGKEEMIRGLHDLSARVTKQESIIKEVREYIESYNLKYLRETNEHSLADVLEVLLEILDKVDKGE